MMPAYEVLGKIFGLGSVCQVGSDVIGKVNMSSSRSQGDMKFCLLEVDNSAVSKSHFGR